MSGRWGGGVGRLTLIRTHVGVLCASAYHPDYVSKAGDLDYNR
jgi:hypothetical protein